MDGITEEEFVKRAVEAIGEVKKAGKILDKQTISTMILSTSTINLASVEAFDAMTIDKKKFHGTNFCETLQKNAKGALHKCFGKSNLNVNYIRPVRPVRPV